MNTSPISFGSKSIRMFTLPVFTRTWTILRSVISRAARVREAKNLFLRPPKITLTILSRKKCRKPRREMPSEQFATLLDRRDKSIGRAPIFYGRDHGDDRAFPAGWLHRRFQGLYQRVHSQTSGYQKSCGLGSTRARPVPEKRSSKVVGGPSASHENKNQPSKSKPHGRLNRPKPNQGNTKRTAQSKSGKGPDPKR